MKLTVDFSSVKEGFELLPGGVYPVTILSANVVKSKSSDGHNLLMNAEITDGEFIGRRVFVKSFSLKQEAAGFLKRSFEALGIEFDPEEPLSFETAEEDDEKLSRGEAVPLVDPDLVGLEGWGNVIINKYKDASGNEHTNNQIDKFVAEPTEE